MESYPSVRDRHIKGISLSSSHPPHLLGISIVRLLKVSEILGVSQWELMNYVGKTSIVDRQLGDTTTLRRIKLTRKLFNVK